MMTVRVLFPLGVRDHPAHYENLECSLVASRPKAPAIRRVPNPVAGWIFAAVIAADYEYIAAPEPYA